MDKHELIEATKGIDSFLNIFKKAEQVRVFLQQADLVFDRVRLAEKQLHELTERCAAQREQAARECQALEEQVAAARARAKEAEEKAIQAEARCAERLRECALKTQEAQDAAKAEFEASMAVYSQELHQAAHYVEIEHERLAAVKSKIAELKGL